MQGEQMTKKRPFTQVSAVARGGVKPPSFDFQDYGKEECSLAVPLPTAIPVVIPAVPLFVLRATPSCRDPAVCAGCSSWSRMPVSFFCRVS